MRAGAEKGVPDGDRRGVQGEAGGKLPNRPAEKMYKSQGETSRSNFKYNFQIFGRGLFQAFSACLIL